jgi:hypothetical protein
MMFLDGGRVMCISKEQKLIKASAKQNYKAMRDY